MVLLDCGKTSISHVALSKQYPHVHRGISGDFSSVFVMFCAGMSSHDLAELFLVVGWKIEILQTATITCAV